jgi:hypothetical protein
MSDSRPARPRAPGRLVHLAGVVGFAGLVSLVPTFPARAEPPKPIVTLTSPSVWADVDAKAIKGRPARLAWSDDRSTLYLQTVEGTTPESLAFHHYLVHKGGAPAAVAEQPSWVAPYWKWKSAKSLAGDPLLTIEVDTQKKVLDNLNGTAANKAVYLAESPISGQALTLARQSGGEQIVNQLLLKGHVIGEFLDQMIVPGYTFSWSPEELRLIAYRSQTGRLTIMDDEGRTESVGDTKDVLLPAWSDDGAAIAYLQQSRGHLSVRVVEVVGR